MGQKATEIWTAQASLQLGRSTYDRPLLPLPARSYPAPHEKNAFGEKGTGFHFSNKKLAEAEAMARHKNMTAFAFFV